MTQASGTRAGPWRHGVCRAQTVFARARVSVKDRPIMITQDSGLFIAHIGQNPVSVVLGFRTFRNQI